MEETTVSITYKGVELNVKGEFDPGRPGQLFGPPERCYPDDPGAFIAESITAGGVEIMPLLSATQIEAIEDHAFDAVDNARYGQHPED